MPKETARQYKPKVRIPLPFDVAVGAFLKVDPKKLPKGGKLTTTPATGKLRASDASHGPLTAKKASKNEER